MPRPGFLVLLVSVALAFSSAAHAQWVENGIPIRATTSSNNLYVAQIVEDGEGGAIVSWVETGSGVVDIRAQRVDGRGRALWGAGGVSVCAAAEWQRDPVMVSDGEGGAFLAWVDERNSNGDVFAQHIDAGGNPSWTMDGVAVCDHPDEQEDIDIAADGSGGVIVVWLDFRDLNSVVYGQRVGSSGLPLWTAQGVGISPDTTGALPPKVTASPNGDCFVVWSDMRVMGYWELYGQRVSAGGAPLWSAGGTQVSTAVGHKTGYQLMTGDGGGFMVVYEYQGSGGNAIHGQYMGNYGARYWLFDGQPLCTGTISSFVEKPDIVPDGSGGAIVAWNLYPPATGYMVVAQRVTVRGDTLWGGDGVLVCDAVADQALPRVSADGFGGAVIVWQDSRNFNNDVYAQRVNPWGEILWGSAGVPVARSWGEQVEPQVATDGAGGLIATWQDERTGFREIYAQRMEAHGYWGYPAPEIAFVRDVPGDQGGELDLAWYASRLDPGPEHLVTYYTQWRALGAGAMKAMPGATLLASAAEFRPGAIEGPVIRMEETAGETFFWEYLNTTSAGYFSGYSEILPSLFDSTEVSDEDQYFQVIGHTQDPLIYWTSEPDSGKSVDNLAPAAPQSLSGEGIFPPLGLLLTWDPNVEPDLSHYLVYRGFTPDFEPGAGNLIGSPEDTSLVDEGWDPDDGEHYKVFAVDTHGNLSPFALLSPTAVTSVGDPVRPSGPVLAQNAPNPFPAATRIRFHLAEDGPVRLMVYDVSGRAVATLADGELPTGWHDRTWDGRDGAGRAVASGLYYYRLDGRTFTETRRMLLIR